MAVIVGSMINNDIKRMKHLITICLLIASFTTSAQYDARQLCNEHMKLNGGIRSQFGGMSRNFIPITIPEGTTHIAVSFNISESEDHIDDFALTSNILSILATGNILSISDVMSNMSGKPGTGIIDFVLFDDPDCVGRYVRKEETTGCHSSFYRRNSKGGVYTYKLDNPSRRQYWLCLRNPSEYSPVYFQVEATAILK